MDCNLGYFDLDTRALEPLENPFGPQVVTMYLKGTELILALSPRETSKPGPVTRGET
jgi:hypothetical protein